jgi:aminopeptidase N
MKKAVILFLFLITVKGLILADGYHRDPNVDIIHYEFIISINDTTDNITGTAVVGIGFTGPCKTVILDLKNSDSNGKGMKVSSVSIAGKEVSWTHLGDKLTVNLPGTYDKDGSCEIKVSYSGVPRDGLIISKNKFGRRTFFSDHWPDRASNYLPVVDHPSDKATVDFVVTSPSHYRVVASGYLVEESTMPDGTTLTHWKEDVPLPVKVMAFAAAPFSVQFVGKAAGVPVWSWVFNENRSEGFSDYSVALKPLAFYSELIGPYSYEKLANVQSKTIFGGLENASCIFYAENSVTGKGRAESLIAHEIAHQWFGNSVTEKDWRDIWLSEGFATFLTNEYLLRQYGPVKFRESMISDRNRVLRYDQRMHGAVIDTTMNDLMGLLNPDSYQKGGWVLHMLRNEIGDDSFWKGMRLFYSRFRNGNALTSDLQKIMEEVSGRSLDRFFLQWLYFRDEPVLKIDLADNGKGTKRITVEQLQKKIYSFRLEVFVEDGSGKRIFTIPVEGKTASLEIKAETTAKITPDPDVKLLFRQDLK